jgi:hypothetical protein
MDDIQFYLDDIIDNIVAKLPDPIRPTALAARIVQLITKIKNFIEDVQNVIDAIKACISVLLQMINNLKAMIQGVLNAIANLLKELCNWKLPSLPSFPNFFGMFMNFGGFNLGVGHLKFNAKFDFNFSMKDCKVELPNLNIFRNQPTGQTITLADGTKLFYLPDLNFVPWNGKVVTVPYSDVMWDAQTKVDIQTERQIPVFAAPFSSDDRLGSLPDPAKILSDYHLTPEQYRDNVVSLIAPELVPVPEDKDYQQPDQDRQQRFVATLRERVNLGQVVASGFDPNVVAAWIFWMDLNRLARQGVWIQENEAAYAEYIKPTLDYLRTAEVPYNHVLGSSTIRKAPEGLPFVALKDLPETQLGPILWRLSLLEAGLLGLPRNLSWDNYRLDPLAVPDYQVLHPSGSYYTATVPIPVGDVGFRHDQAWEAPLSKVLAKGARDIASNTLWRTGKIQYRYIYDEFANVVETDRYVQYWKDFEDRWRELCQEDPEFLALVMGDWRILDGAVNPLGDTQRYDRLREDWANRDREWFGGRELLPLPKAPKSDDTAQRPTKEQSGWNLQGVPLITDENGVVSLDVDALLANPVATPSLDPMVFLARPDVRQLPLSEQMAMLELNQAFASAMKSATQQLYNLNQALAEAQSHSESMTSFANALTAGMFAMENTSSQLKVPGGWSSTESAAMKDAIAHIGTAGPGTGNTAGGSTPGSGIGDTGLGSDSTGGNGVPIGGGIQVFKARAQNLPTASVVFVGPDGKLRTVNPTMISVDPPYFDGVTIKAPNSDLEVELVTVYGSVVQIKGQRWSQGGLLYAGLDGILTQDFQSLLTGTHWVIPMGRALSIDTFVYEPHIPTNVMFRPD